MPRAKSNKLYRTFVKGLITEAGYLTYPEDASYAESNTVLSRKGNRTRRLGINFEDGYVLEPTVLSNKDACSEYIWHSAAKKVGQSFAVVQMGAGIYFYALDGSPMSDHKKPYVLDISQYGAPGATAYDIVTNPCHFSSGAGYLFIAHPYCEPMVVEYDGNTFNTFKVVIQVRDYDGLNDNLPSDAEPSTLSKEHHYNLLNQGWIAPGTTPAAAPGEGESGSSDTNESVYYNPYTGEEVPYDRGGNRLNPLERPD